MGAREIRTKFLLQRLSKVYQHKCADHCTNLVDIAAKKVLIISPHADDEVIGCGAAINHFVKNDVEVFVLVVTQESEKSIAKNYNYTPNQRIQESLKAKEILNYKLLIYFEFPELGFLGNAALKAEFIQQLEALLLEIKPDCVFLPNAKEMHPDHQVIGELSFNLINDGKKNKSYRFIKHLLIYEVWGPVPINSYLEVSEESNLIKELSIACYESQMASVDYKQIINFIGNYRGTTLREVYQKENTPASAMYEAYTLFRENELPIKYSI